MKIAIQLLNRFFCPPILVNSVPKSGTNLARKAICNLPGIYWSGLHIGESSVGSRESFANQSAVLSACKVGVDRPVDAGVTWLKNEASQVGNGSVSTCHIPFSKKAHQVFRKRRLSHIAIVRHPADVALSHAHYINLSPDHFAYGYYKDLSDEERVRTSILGVPKIGLESLSSRYTSILKWEDEGDALILKFENLVGPKGGGSLQKQIDALDRLAKYCQIRVSSNVLAESANGIFGGTHTFEKGRGGQIGGWRQDMSLSNKEVLRAELGKITKRLDYDLSIPQR